MRRRESPSATCTEGLSGDKECLQFYLIFFFMFMFIFFSFIFYFICYFTFIIFLHFFIFIFICRRMHPGSYPSSPQPTT